MPSYSVSESNSTAFTDATASVAQSGTFSVLGIARAGTSQSGVGQWYQGTYGSLMINADGTFTYRLDNSDPDTNVLGSGMSAQERFTYTYSLNGVVTTSTLNFVVSGMDEPGQIVTTTVSTIQAPVVTIGLLERIVSTSTYGVLLDDDEMTHPEMGFVNDGALVVSSTDDEALGFGVWDYFGGPVPITNNGLIEATSSWWGATGLSNSTEGPLINNGVIRAIGTGAGDGTWNNPPTSAIGLGPGIHWGSAINTGTIEAISEFGGAAGVTAGAHEFRFENSGLIYASSGATTEEFGSIVGIAWGQSDDVTIINSGTIMAVSTAGITSYGITLFPDSTNVYQYGTIINSGTIVATVAIRAVEGYSTGIHVTNSGRIEGDLVISHNLNIITNSVGASWVGDLHLGADSDVVRNSGTITGDVLLNDGADFFDGRGGSVTGFVEAGGGRDLLIGGSYADRLNGGDGDDRIQGGAGDDTLTGGSGSDVFIYGHVADSIASARDTISGFESGIDKIDLSQLGPSSVSFTSSGGYTIVDAAVTGGTVSIRVEGVVVASDVITAVAPANLVGTAGDDWLIALSGDVQVSGGAGQDILVGTSGANLLDGGSDADIMHGSAGDDVYIVDSDGDRIFELDGEGVDEVHVWVDYTLQAFTENLVLLGSDNIAGLGNEGDNILTGNSGDNGLHGDSGDDILWGGAGADTLSGGPGDDRYLYDHWSQSTAEQTDYLLFFEFGADSIDISGLDPISITFTNEVAAWAYTYFTTVDVETAEGTLVIHVDGWVDHSDFIASFQPTVGSVFDDQLIGGSSSDWFDGADGNDRISGGEGSDTISGGLGNDRLSGGVGHDVLTGGGGADHFLINTNIADNVDRITDFAAEDRLYLSNAIFPNLATGTLTADAFHRGTVPETAAHRIIYDPYSGQAYYDPDGTGPASATVFVAARPGTQLTADNFVVYDPATLVVESATSYTLVDDERNLHLTGTDPVNGTGNALANRITANAAANVLTGGAGGDVFAGTAAQLDGDTIIDFTAEDAIVIADANFAAFSFSLSGSTLTYSGGSLTLGAAVSGPLMVSAIAGGGVQITIGQRATLTLTESGQDYVIGGDVAVYGTTSGGEVIEILHGDVLFDASFNIGGDTVVLPGNAGTYSATLSGSFVTIEGGGITVAIPVGANGLSVQFADSTRTLRFDTTAGQVLLGTQPVTATTATVEASGEPLVDPVEVGPDSLGRLVLAEAGQDIDIGGNVTIFGSTSPGEVITVLDGTIVLDASFNVGGDTVALPGNAADYTATLAGSFVTIAGGDISIAIPVGTAGLTVDFADTDKTLRFDPGSGQVMLGDQPVTSSGGSIIAAEYGADKGGGVMHSLAIEPHDEVSPFAVALELHSFSFA